jgi:hypothetical protein
MFGATMPTSALLTTLVQLGFAYLIWTLFQAWRERYRCPYCGKDGWSHDPDCPRNGIEGM